MNSGSRGRPIRGTEAHHLVRETKTSADMLHFGKPRNGLLQVLVAALLPSAVQQRARSEEQAKHLGSATLVVKEAKQKPKPHKTAKGTR